MKRSMLSWSIALPVITVIGQIPFLPLSLASNIAFAYACFRANLYFRSWRGAIHLNELGSNKHITWTPSQDFEDHLIRLSNKVKVETSQGGVRWKYEANKDIHDDIIQDLQDTNSIFEFSRNYRRARTQQILKPFKKE